MADTNVIKAQDWMTQGQKKSKPGLMGSLFGGGPGRFEDAAECYQKAGNLYKLSKKYEEAANAFKLAADCSVKSANKHDAATHMISASNVLRKVSTKDAAECLSFAIQYYTDEGRFSMAAKQEKELGALYEEDQMMQEALDAYQRAADFFEGENSASSANQCLLKVAHIAATLENYKLAIEIYEKVAKASLDNNLLKWSVKEYLLKAGMCHLAVGDNVATSKALDKYQDLDVTFPSTRECKLLVNLVKAVENGDPDEYTQAVSDFDSIMKLDAWKTSILLKVKKRLTEEGGEDDDLA